MSCAISKFMSAPKFARDCAADELCLGSQAGRRGTQSGGVAYGRKPPIWSQPPSSEGRMSDAACCPVARLLRFERRRGLTRAVGMARVDCVAVGVPGNSRPFPSRATGLLGKVST
jgi:hypothetical protein